MFYSIETIKKMGYKNTVEFVRDFIKDHTNCSIKYSDNGLSIDYDENSSKEKEFSAIILDQRDDKKPECRFCHRYIYDYEQLTGMNKDLFCSDGIECVTSKSQYWHVTTDKQNFYLYNDNRQEAIKILYCPICGRLLHSACLLGKLKI